MMENVISNVANSYSTKAYLDYNFLLPPTINDPNCSLITEFATEKVVGKNEDKCACYSHHSGNFNIDEDTLEIGTKLYVNYSIDYLNSNI